MEMAFRPTWRMGRPAALPTFQHYCLRMSPAFFLPILAERGNLLFEDNVVNRFPNFNS
jgi:hypothetical protein